MKQSGIRDFGMWERLRLVRLQGGESWVVGSHESLDSGFRRKDGGASERRWFVVLPAKAGIQTRVN